MTRNGLAVLGSALLIGTFLGCNSLSGDRKVGWLTPPSKRIVSPVDLVNGAEEDVLRGQTEDKHQAAQRYLNRSAGYTTYPDGSQVADYPPPSLILSDQPSAVEGVTYTGAAMLVDKMLTPTPENTPIPPAPGSYSTAVPAPTQVFPAHAVPVQPAPAHAVPVQPAPVAPPVASAWDSAPPALPPGWDQITPEQVMPPAQHLSSWGTSPSAIDALPWESGHSVSIEEKAKEEELAAQKARLLEIARKNEKDATISYLRPIDPWVGPFAKREATNAPDEKEIILAAFQQEPVFKIEENIELYDWEKEEQKFDWEQLDPVNLYTKVRDWAGYGPDEKKATAYLEQGYDLLRNNKELKDAKKNEEAAKLFQKAAKRWPDSPLAEDALYLAAECYFFADRYPKALECYKQLISEYHHSRHLDTSVRRLFAIGRYWEKQSLIHKAPMNFTDKSRPSTDTFGNAKKAYEAIFTNDPNGPISDDAVMALAMGFLARGEQPGDSSFENAAFYFSYLRENYPQSRHAVKAREMELHATLNTYHGGGYNRRALNQTEKLANQTLRQYEGDLSPEEKAGIREIKETTLLKQAESDFLMGQYYDKKAEYGAARIHYQKLIEKYPQTTFAERARQRLVAIEGKPDSPGHFDWAKNLIDTTKRARKTKATDDR